MDSTTKNYFRELHNSHKKDALVLWHLKGLTRLALRSFWCDLNFIGDLGMSPSDQILTQQALSIINENLLAKIDTIKSHGFVRRLRDIPNYFDGWARYAGSDYNLAHWNLNLIQYCQTRISRITVKNKTISEAFQIEDIESGLLALASLAHKSPSTFYQLGKALSTVCELSEVPSLKRLNPGTETITRVVSASVPLFRLLKRDIDAIYRMDSPAFEDFVGERLDKMGMNVRRTGNTYTPDGGVDLIASPRGSSFPFLLAVQVKHHRSPRIKTGPGPIKDMQAVLGSLPFHAGMIVTNTSFTPDAKWWASQSPGKLQLHDINSIRNWIAGRYEIDRFKDIPSVIELTPQFQVEIW